MLADELPWWWLWDVTMTAGSSGSMEVFDVIIWELIWTCWTSFSSFVKNKYMSPNVIHTPLSKSSSKMIILFIIFSGMRYLLTCVMTNTLAPIILVILVTGLNICGAGSWKARLAFGFQKCHTEAWQYICYFIWKLQFPCLNQTVLKTVSYWGKQLILLLPLFHCTHFFSCSSAESMNSAWPTDRFLIVGLIFKLLTDIF